MDGIYIYIFSTELINLIDSVVYSLCDIFYNRSVASSVTCPRETNPGTQSKQLGSDAKFIFIFGNFTA